MRARPLINLQAVQPMVARLRALGHDPRALFRGVGLDPGVIDDPDARIPLESLDPLWSGAQQMAEDDCFGLHAAEAVGKGSFGLISYLGVASPTWRDGLVRVQRFFRLFSDASNYELSVDGDVATVLATFDIPPIAPVRQRVEFTVAVLACYGRTNIEGAWRPREVLFEHGEPPAVTEHARIFGVAPRFDAGRSGFRFDADHLALPLRSADPPLLALLESLAVRQLAERPAQNSVAQALRTSLARCGSKVDGSIAWAARQLGMSRRTLQRRLREEGTSHQRVIDDLRSELARRMLTRPELGVSEVAYSLGFSEAAAFHHAFKRWTGTSPSDFRRMARSSNSLAPAAMSAPASSPVKRRPPVNVVLPKRGGPR